MTKQQTETYLAFGFGIVFVTAILSLVVVFPNPTSAQYEVFRIVIALAAGGVGAVIPGLLKISLDLGLSTGQKMLLRAGGALAVFVVVYFYSPAQLAKPSPTLASGPISQTGSGDCNSNLANVVGSIKIDCKK
jgi:hypothetical protein